MAAAARAGETVGWVELGLAKVGWVVRLAAEGFASRVADQAEVKVTEVMVTEVMVAEALAESDIVIGAVPAKAFKIPAAGMKAGAICINVSQHQNFGEGTEGRCVLVPACGKVTIAILARNLLRLYDNFPAPRRAASPMKLLVESPAARSLMLVASFVVVGVSAFMAGRRVGS